MDADKMALVEVAELDPSFISTELVHKAYCAAITGIEEHLIAPLDDQGNGVPEDEEMEKIEVTVDSGAVDHVGPKKVAEADDREATVHASRGMLVRQSSPVALTPRLIPDNFRQSDREDRDRKRE